MKIGIITFHAAFNYGSMLQAYALQTFLERQGHHVEIVNYRPKTQKRGYPKPISFSSLHNVKQTVQSLLFAPTTIPTLYKKWHLFDDFLNKYLHLTREYSSLAELNSANFDYDVLVTGSDQIWNTQTFDFSEAYFGTFVNAKTKKIAYAPSMGPKPEAQDKEYVKRLLKGYSAISVREERTKDFLTDNHLFDDVSLVLDPTMLLDKSDFSGLCSKQPLWGGNTYFTILQEACATSS